MVRHSIFVKGVDMSGTEQKPPVILQMHDDDFPVRFLQDLASPGMPAISHTASVNTSLQPLYQPVQRMMNVAMVDLHCDSLSYPRIDPKRIVSAGLVIRRVFLRAGSNGGPARNDFDTVSAWMRTPSCLSEPFRQCTNKLSFAANGKLRRNHDPDQQWAQPF